MDRSKLVARALAIKLLDQADALEAKKIKTEKEKRELKRLQEMKNLLEKVGVN